MAKTNKDKEDQKMIGDLRVQETLKRLRLKNGLILRVAGDKGGHGLSWAQRKEDSTRNLELKSVAQYLAAIGASPADFARELADLHGVVKVESEDRSDKMLAMFESLVAVLRSQHTK